MHDADKAFYGNGLPYLKISPLRGSLIVIEGTDGVGRSTQIEQLTRWLEVQGYGVVNTGWTRSPLLAETINEAKAGHELNVTTFSLLYAGDFADRLENQIIPALRAGFIVVADRYMYTAFARNAVMGADPEWTRKLFGFAVIPDLVMYLKIDVKHLVPRVLESKGMDYWESGMHLKLGSDIFDSFRRYQARVLREYDRMADEFDFVTVDAQQPIDSIQQELRATIGRYLAGEHRPRRQQASTSRAKRLSGPVRARSRR